MSVNLLFTCAGFAIIDKHSNTLSLIDVREEINSPGFPLVIPQLFVVWVKSQTKGDEEKFDALLSIRHNKQEIASFPLAVSFATSKIHRSIVGLNAMVIPGPGALEFKVSVSSKKVASYSIPINAVPPAQA